MKADGWDGTMLVVISFITLALLLHLLLSAFSRCHAQRVREVWAATSPWRTESEGDDSLSSVSHAEVRNVAKQRLRSSQVEIFTKVSQIKCFVTLPWTIYILIAIALDKPRVGSMLWDTIWVFLTGFYTAMVIRPTLLTSQLMDVFYFMMMLSFVLVVSPYSTSRENYVAPLLSTNSAVVFLTFIQRSIWKTLPTSFIFGLSASATLWAHADACLMHVQFYAIIQAVVVPSVSIIAAVWGRNLEDKMCESLQNQEAKELYRAACAILRSCCDVVIELDGSARVVREHAALSSFLLKPPQAISCFLDHMADDEERAQFVDRLTTPRLVPIGLAENMQVSLKDGNNNLLRLEALWFEYRRVDGQVVYMMGLRDFSDTAGAGVGFRWPTVSLPPQVRMRPAAPVSRSNPQFEELSVPETESVTCDAVGEPVAMIMVDTSQTGMPIVGVSPGFRTRIGRLSSDCNLVDYLVKPEAFRQWICSSINNLAYDEPTVEHHVKLKLPHGEMSAICSLVPPSCDTKGEHSLSIDVESVVILFHSIKRRSKETREHPLPPPTFWGTPPAPLTRMSL